MIIEAAAHVLLAGHLTQPICKCHHAVVIMNFSTCVLHILKRKLTSTVPNLGAIDKRSLLRLWGATCRTAYAIMS